MLLKHMFAHMEANSSQNLKAGFKKCGLFPLDKDPVLKRMPNRQMEESVPVLELLSESFIDNLRTTRMQVTETRPYRRRRRVNVPAGRGITAADLEVDTTTRTVTSSALHSDPDHSIHPQIGTPTRTTTGTNLEPADIWPQIERTAPIVPPYEVNFYSDHSTDSEIASPTRTTTTNLEAANSEPAMETTAPAFLSSSVHLGECLQPHPPKTAKNKKAPHASQCSTGIEPRPSGSGLKTVGRKRRHPAHRKTPKAKQRSQKKGTHMADSDSSSDSSCVSRISYQESDCSENWCDLADLNDDLVRV